MHASTRLFFFLVALIPISALSSQNEQGRNSISGLRDGQQTDACRAFLAEYSGPLEEARENPWGFTRDFRAYLFPEEGTRELLAELVMTSGSSPPAQYMPLFKISSEVSRARILRLALRVHVNVLASADGFEIENPQLLAAISEDLLKRGDGDLAYGVFFFKQTKTFRLLDPGTRSRLLMREQEITARSQNQ